MLLLMFSLSNPTIQSIWLRGIYSPSSFRIHCLLPCFGSCDCPLSPDQISLDAQVGSFMFMLELRIQSSPAPLLLAGGTSAGFTIASTSDSSLLSSLPISPGSSLSHFRPPCLVLPSPSPTSSTSPHSTGLSSKVKAKPWLFPLSRSLPLLGRKVSAST